MDAVGHTPPAAERGTDDVAAAPAVVAVVVTCDPGWWLEECLESLARQDYRALSVLVIDAASTEDPTARIAAVMPTAYVRRVHRRHGFGAASNEVIKVVEGATHFVFCHDDVILEPGAVRLLVEEAFRSNAGAVAPKLVGWFDAERLLAVGMGADRFGVPVALVERGELDQAQHDAVRDVFFAPSACTLVRADLFTTLGGFDPGYPVLGEDLDLCWRVHLAGARVVVAPQARVRHLEATESGQRAIDGSLRAAGPDAPERAARLPVAPVMFPEDADAALAPEAGPAGAVEVLATVPDQDVYVVDPDVEQTVWDLDRWDREDEAAEHERTASPSRQAHRRRIRREPAADAEGWTAGDGWEDGWEQRPGRRRIRPASPLTRPHEQTPRGPDADALDDGRAVARLRAMATNCGAARQLVRLPTLFLLTVLEAVVRFAGRGGVHARRTLRPWVVLFGQSGSVRKSRSRVKRIRTVPDSAIVAQQVGGVARLRQALRLTVAEPLPGLWDDDARLGALVWIACLAVIGYGSRHLLIGHLPTVGELAPWPSLSALTRAAASGWRTTGLGAAGPPPVAFGELALAGVVFLGHTALLQHVLILGMLPLGALGAARLARPIGGRRATLVALVAYLVVPVPYNALYGGRWSGLVTYAAFPWLLGLVLRGAGEAPFVERPAPPAAGRPARPWLTTGPRLVGIALIAAAAGAVVPSLLAVLALTGLALLVGGALTGAVRAGRRAAFLAVAGAVGGAVLLLPWSLGWLPPTGESAAFGGIAGAYHPVRLAALLRFQSGTLGAGPLGYALLVVAAFPLVVGRGWRAAWATRLWTVALASFGLAWAGQHAALGVGWPPPEVLLVPAALAVALSAAFGVTAFEIDLSGYNFGWRQVASGVAVVAAALACLPVIALSVNGRWRQPADGFDSVLSWMGPKKTDGDFRVLWIGRPAVLPIAGWRSPDGVAYATSVDGPPDLTDQWPGTSRGPTRLLSQTITLVRQGRTTGVGHLLAPMGVRYVVVVDRPSPLDLDAGDTRSVPGDLASGLDSQLDLEALDRSGAMTVYENVAWAPMRFQLPQAAAATAALDDPRAARSVDLAGAHPLLPVIRGETTFSGPVPDGTSLELAEAPSSHWRLTVGGRPADRAAAWGSANLFTATAGGQAVLRYTTPVGWRAALALQAMAWLLALAVVVRARRRPTRPALQVSAPAEGSPLLVGAGGVAGLVGVIGVGGVGG